MSRGPAVRRADIERAIAALKAAGYGIACVEVCAGGVVRVIPAFTDAPAAAPMNDLDAFRARRAAKGERGGKS